MTLETKQYKMKTVMKMDGNICRYIPVKETTEDLQVINIVLEKEHLSAGKQQILGIYRLCFVAAGTAKYIINDKYTSLSKGDIFFCLPSVPYTIEPLENFSYIFIDFLGLRANSIIDSLGVGETNNVFHKFDDMEQLLKNALFISAELRKTATEGALLYILSMIGERCVVKDNNDSRTNNVMLNIKNHINRFYNQTNLSLTQIAEMYSYSPKYLSALFKKSFKIDFCGYLNTVRIQQACALMDSGFTCVSEIAALCGYSDALYFSKCFKKKLGVSPKEYIKSLK